MKNLIQKAIHRPGKLHKELGIPKDEKIPMSLLNTIINAKVNQVIKNPTKIGNKKIKVTQGIEHRAILARNLKQLKNK
ncbi:hypothetical protein K9L16_02115 [Candidatus Pacearchaeota archaeon]|nr:hypothetical protein [Candidatus Pacearchaeota archaeon]